MMLLGCQQGMHADLTDPPPPPPLEPVQATAAETQSYLRLIAPRIVRRPLNAEELASSLARFHISHHPARKTSFVHRLA